MAAPPLAVVVGCARDCAGLVGPCLAAVGAAVSGFYAPDEVAYLFFENDSTDGTLAVLTEFASRDPSRRRVLVENGLCARLTKRTHRLAHARNTMLDQIQKLGWLTSLEVMIVADLDEVNASIHGMDQALRMVTAPRDIEWACDVATANQAEGYYDIWALRTTEVGWANSYHNEQLAAQQASAKRGLSYFLDEEQEDNESCCLNVESSPRVALSAFGGLGLYRASILRNDENPALLRSGLVYDGCDASMRGGECLRWLEEQDCEHVSFHASLNRLCADFKLVIVPSLLNCLHGAKSSNRLAPWARAGGSDNNKTSPQLSLALNADGTYTAAIKGVVEYTTLS